MFNVGDLVEGGFGILHRRYGLGIIVQKKTFAPRVTAYRVYWSNYHPTWEPTHQLTLATKAK